MRRALVFLSLALLSIVVLVATTMAPGSLAVFTDQGTAGGNTFTTVACFPLSNTGLLDATAQAADTGGDGDGFELNPTNAFADGGGFASNIDGRNDRHRYYNYGMSISASCIAGIEVRLDWWLDAIGGNNYLSVELSWNGGTSWTSAKTDSVETVTEHTAVLGSRKDSWGRTWTASEFNDANFRVRLTSNASSGGRDFYLDWVPVKVYYRP